MVFASGDPHPMMKDDLAGAVGGAALADREFIVAARLSPERALRRSGDKRSMVEGDDECSNPHCVWTISVSYMACVACAWQ
jgi:hypothetical protein